jgi:ubiquinone/menaquinone biosynthesis C-methylase UbiE
MFRAAQLYTFLQYCSNSPLEKEVLECGAGVWPSLVPLLVRFHEHGYVTHGIEISDERLAATRDYCEEHQMDLDIRKGDMRELPFADRAMSFVFSYNAIFHMTKKDVAASMREIERILKPKGLCFVNFLSVDSDAYGQGEELNRGEFLERQHGEEMLHSYYEDNEADEYFGGFKVLYKEKRILERLLDGDKHVRAYIDYIAQKR